MKAGLQQIEQKSNEKFDQEKSNGTKTSPLSLERTESGLRFKKLDEIKSFWGKVTLLPCLDCVQIMMWIWDGHTSLFVPFLHCRTTAVTTKILIIPQTKWTRKKRAKS